MAEQTSLQKVSEPEGDAAETTLTNQDEERSTSGGRKLGLIGKIFLLLVVLTFDGGAAYYIVDDYYSDVYKWLHQSNDAEVYYEIKSIIVNPAQTDGERYLLVSLGLKLSSKDDVASIKKQEPVIRDRAIALLSKQTVGELNNTAKRNALKKRLGIMINNTIGKQLVRNLFFTEYVMQ